MVKASQPRQRSRQKKSRWKCWSTRSVTHITIWSPFKSLYQILDSMKLLIDQITYRTVLLCLINSFNKYWKLTNITCLGARLWGEDCPTWAGRTHFQKNHLNHFCFCKGLIYIFGLPATDKCCSKTCILKKHLPFDCGWQESSEQKDEIASLKATVAGMTR